MIRIILETPSITLRVLSEKVGLSESAGFDRKQNYELQELIEMQQLGAIESVKRVQAEALQAVVSVMRKTRSEGTKLHAAKVIIKPVADQAAAPYDGGQESDLELTEEDEQLVATTLDAGAKPAAAE